MSIRSVKFVPAVLAGVVAGGNLATTTDLQAQVLTTSAEAAVQTAPDSCLSAPKGATPAGSHWYYRLDRVTKRQCWYLREEGDATDDKFARAAPPASAAEEPAPPSRSISRKSISDKSISDARAEWQPRAEANASARIERTAAPAAPAPVVASNNPRMAMPNVLAPAPLSSVRWNEATPTRASVDPTDIQLAAATPPAAEPPQAQLVQQQPAAEQIAPVATMDAASAKPTASLQKLLMVMAAALALAGLTVSAIVRIGRLRARRAMKRKRRAMWDAAKAANSNVKTRRRAQQGQPQAQPQPMFRDEDAVLRRAAAAAAPQPRTAQGAPTRPPRERPQQERPYAPQERRHAPQDRVPQQRVSQDRAAPADRDSERQVTEMLSRLARTAHN